MKAIHRGELFVRMLLFLGLVFFTSCSQMKFAYNNAPWLLRPKVYRYTSFDHNQKESIRSGLETYFDWNRKTMLPQYVAFLKDLEVETKKRNLEASQLEQLRDRYHQLYVQSLTPLANPGAKILTSLSDKQITELEQTFQRRMEQQKREYLTGTKEQQLRRRAQKTVSLVEDWVGNLDREQEKKIQSISLTLPYLTPQWLSEKEASEKKLITLLRSKAGVSEVESFIRQWMTSNKASLPKMVDDPVWKDYYVGSLKLIAAVGPLLNEKQLAKIQSKVRGYTEDFETLLHRSDSKMSANY